MLHIFDMDDLLIVMEICSQVIRRPKMGLNTLPSYIIGRTPI